MRTQIANNVEIGRLQGLWEHNPILELILSADEVNDEASDLLALAWPDGASVAERAFLSSLAPERSAETLRRLRAVLEVEAAGKVADIQGIGAAASLGRTLFFRIRKQWKGNRSLRSLAPYQPRNTGTGGELQGRTGEADIIAASKVDRRKPESVAALEEMLADPLATNRVIASRVIAVTGSARDRRTIGRLVQLERRRLNSNPQNLVPVYGRSLLADVTAVDILIRVENDLEALVMAIVLERSTGLVLGYAAGRAEGALALQVKAALRAVAFLARERADRPLGDTVAMRVVVGPGAESQIEHVKDAMAQQLGPKAVVAKGWRRFGERTASLVGRLGRIALRPMATQKAFDGTLDVGNWSGPVLSIEEADALIGTAVEKHNRSIIEGLRKVGLAGEAEGFGAMSALLLNVFEAALI